MSKKTLLTSQALALATAGKLTIQSAAVSAEDLDNASKLGVVNEAETQGVEKYVPRMRMDQLCTPLDVCAPPTDDFLGDFDNDEYSGGKYGSVRRADDGGKTGPADPVDEPEYFAPNGVIFAGDVDDFGEGGPRPKIDFIISNVPNKPMDLFLLYSDRPFGKNKPGKDGRVPDEAKAEDETFRPLFDNAGGGSGALGIPVLGADGGLSPDLKFVTGVRIMPQKPIPGFDRGDGNFIFPNPLGSTPKNLRTVVISVGLNKLTDMVASGQLPENVFFQAAAFPVGEDGSPNFTAFNKALYSDVDQFIIEIPGDEGDLSTDPGTKGGLASNEASSGSGSKSASDTSTGGSGAASSGSDSGGKTTSTTPADSGTGTDTGGNNTSTGLGK